MNYTLIKTADHNREDFDAAAVETVKQNIYVDDCLCSVVTDTQAVHFKLFVWQDNSLSYYPKEAFALQSGYPIQEK